MKMHLRRDRGTHIAERGYSLSLKIVRCSSMPSAMLQLLAGSRQDSDCNRHRGPLLGCCQEMSIRWHGHYAGFA